MTLWFSRVIITTFLVLGVMSFSPAPSQANTRVSKRVLVLHSYHQGYAWTDNVTRALQQQFEQSDFNVELFIEYMDTKRLQPESAFPRLASLYDFKYSALRFDAIICCDNNALDFLVQYHHKVFHSTPVIFCGINNFEPSMLSEHDDFTGVYEQLDLRASLDLIVVMRPPPVT
ncbi:MAG: hypothetical protein JRG71_05215 [Deltaproteobacteria bacterium]|nr:hypothetical protein [Deltaproteobacteria bacterium]